MKSFILSLFVLFICSHNDNQPKHEKTETGYYYYYVWADWVKNGSRIGSKSYITKIQKFEIKTEQYKHPRDYTFKEQLIKQFQEHLKKTRSDYNPDNYSFVRSSVTLTMNPEASMKYIEHEYMGVQELHKNYDTTVITDFVFDHTK